MQQHYTIVSPRIRDGVGIRRLARRRGLQGQEQEQEQEQETQGEPDKYPVHGITG
jgi:hypothetical protein